MVGLPNLGSTAAHPSFARRACSIAALALIPLVLGVPSGGARALAVSTVTVQVIGKGTVTSSPAGINCGNGTKTCNLAFSASGTTTLTATDVSGWSFDCVDRLSGCARRQHL